MLIEFSVTNFRSIRERQTLSLVSDSGREFQQTNTVSVLEDKLDLLRSAAIYGANAAGKSNLIKALQAMKNIILASAQGQRGLDLPITPYLFDEHVTQPTEFEVSIVVQQIRYQYGFIATRRQILEEWLIAYPKGRPQAWIDRRFVPEKERYQWENSEKLSGPQHIWQSATRPNALFLSTAIQLNSLQLQPIFDWFQSTLQIITTDRLSVDATIRTYGEGEAKAKLVRFLQAADFAINDVIVERSKPYEYSYFTSRRVEPSIRMLAEQPLQQTEEIYSVKTLHRGTSGELFPLAIEEESEGTQKFFALAGPWLNAIQQGNVVVVDEMNEHLHPNLVRFLVQTIHNPALHEQPTQLIFTTHETSILSQDVFRRDQIWFTEKDEFNATRLYPLSDFSPRKGVENLEKNYLQGRYGALPYFREITTAFDGAEP